MDRLTRRVLLYDFYGSLLTQKQQEIYDLYYQQDLSLGEIAELQGVSRPAVYDLLKRAEEALENYETKLGLIKRQAASQECIQMLFAELKRLQQVHPSNEYHKLASLLKKLEDNG